MPTCDTRLLFALSEDLKERLKETGNQSAYIRESVRRRRDRYEKALDRLSGWTHNEIRALMDVMGSTSIDHATDTGSAIASAMRDAYGKATGWGITTARWNQLADEVKAREPTARAIRHVADEYWSEASGHVEV